MDESPDVDCQGCYYMKYSVRNRTLLIFFQYNEANIAKMLFA